MLLVFGKYMGKNTQELPSSYLRWLSVNLKQEWRQMFCNNNLIAECEAELRYRTKNNCHIGDD